MSSKPTSQTTEDKQDANPNEDISTKSPHPKPNEDNDDDEDDSKLIQEVLACDDKEYRKILGVKDNYDTKKDEMEAIVEAAWRRGMAAHPRYSKIERAGLAFAKVISAAKALGVDDETVGDVERWQDPDEGGMDGVEKDIPIPPQPIQAIYTEAQQYVEHLQTEPPSQTATQALASLNDRIRKRNKEEEQPDPDVWTIDYGELAKIYKEARPAMDRIRKNAEDSEATAMLNQFNQSLESLLKHHHYPDWRITPATVAGMATDSKGSKRSKNGTPRGALRQDRSSSVSTENRPAHGNRRKEESKPLFVMDDDDTTEDEDPEFGAALFQPALRSKWGSNVDTVGWLSGRGVRYINRYGPKNAAIYRIESDAATLQYERDPPLAEKVTNKANRNGEQTDPETGKLVFTKRHILAIYGVAWEMLEADKSDGLELMDPAAPRNRWITTYVYVKWDVGNNKTEMKWETRASLRVRWGNKRADKAIYDAACEAQARYEELKTGKRPALSRSPSVGLIEDEVQKTRDLSLKPRTRSSEPRSRQQSVRPSIETSPPVSPSPAPSSKAKKQQVIDQLYSVDSFAGLPWEDQAKCITAVMSVLAVR